MMTTRMSALCALLMTLVVSHEASAHEFWLQPKQFWWEPAQSMPLSLRVGHGDHSARSRIPSRRITRFEVIGPGDEALDLRSQARPGEDTELRFDAPGSYIVVLATDNQARSDLPADRFNEYLRAEGLTPALAAREQAGLTRADGSERYSRQAKSLVQVGISQQQSHVTQAVGLRLEIVPEINPYAEPRPSQLPVRVLFEGKPLAGALVKMSNPTEASKLAVSRISDEQGRAVFDMPSQGQWLMHVAWTQVLPAADEADFDTVFASLTFGLPNVASMRPLTASDLVTLREIGTVSVSRDGRWVTWDQRETDLASNSVRSRLWLLDLEHPNDPLPLSSASDLDASHPSFSGDGEWIYFLSDGELWRAPIGEGTARQISDFDVSIAGYSLSPTGADVAIWADVSTACNELPCTLPQPVDNCCGTGRGFDDAYVQRADMWRRQQTRSTIYVPHRDEWMMPEIRHRTFVMSVNGGKATSAMGRWLGDAQQVTWSADGRALFFTLREARREERFSFNLDVIASRIDNSNPINLTAESAGVDALPVASPDGRWLAYASDGALQLRDLTTGTVTSLAAEWGASVRSIAWTADGSSLLVTARVGLDEPLFLISLDTRKVTRLTAEGRVAKVVPMPAGGAVFTLDTILQPADLYRLSAEGQWERLTAINDDRLRDIDIPHFERFDFNGAKGEIVSAWMIASNERQRPVVLLIRDGEPANSWSRHWNPLLFSAPGYRVIGVERDQLTLEDLRLGLAAAGVDLENVCIAGDGAYGGYLAYRIATEWLQQPRCLIANGGVVDAIGMAYESDEPWRYDWQERSTSGRRNLLQQVAAWRTPLLILHGERNFRVPYTQSLAAFTAAQRQNVPSRLVVFPDEGLRVHAPKNAIQWYGEVFNWLDRWLPQRE
jgi:dipeptidyl aminopeptidase/acylaminoacyl peptidase/uncharacterized GH25 family protein